MAIQSNPRMGHSLVMRNGEAWIFGGQNGVDLGDVTRVSIPSTSSITATQEQLCKSKWMESSFCSLVHVKTVA